MADRLRRAVVAVRLVFVVTTFLGGIGAIAYLVAWVVLPSARRG
jgi:phage shock protein PspC (stress-responsive transcriptional regulator)